VVEKAAAQRYMSQSAYMRQAVHEKLEHRTVKQTHSQRP
jgi:hypothetical protein